MNVGDTLEGRYELRESLGGGGLGQVFRAWDTRLRRELTVKVLAPGRCPADALRRFSTLVTTAAGARHPGVVPVQLTAGAAPLVVSEALRGEHLGALGARLGPVPWNRAIELIHACADILSALAVATGSAHRALKPSNVWIAEDNVVRILDFGIAELGVQPAPPRADGTHVDYRAPEQIEGAPGDAASDVFTLGVLLFELLTGVHPFSGATAFQASRKILIGPAPRPAELAPGVPVPAQIDALLARALARAPSDRIKNTADMATQLAQVRRSPGVLPTITAPVPADSPDEGTQALPAAEYEEDPTTALSVPKLRALLAPPKPEPPSPPEPAVSEAAELPQPEPALPPLEDRTLALSPLPAQSPDPTLALSPLPPQSPDTTLALPTAAPQPLAADSDDDGPTVALPRLPAQIPPPADPTEILPTAAIHKPPRSARNPAPARPAPAPAPRSPLQAWIVINGLLGLVILALLLALLLRE